MDIGAFYSTTKLVHITCVALSGSLFTVRGLWVIATQRQLWRWLRVVPHLLDTLLLASGLTLAFLIHQYPFFHSDWLTAKVIGLVVYIGLGTMVFRGPYGRSGRALTACGCIGIRLYRQCGGQQTAGRIPGYMSVAVAPG